MAWNMGMGRGASSLQAMEVTVNPDGAKTLTR